MRGSEGGEGPGCGAEEPSAAEVLKTVAVGLEGVRVLRRERLRHLIHRRLGAQAPRGGGQGGGEWRGTRTSMEALTHVGNAS